VYRDFQVLKRTAQCTIAERRTPELSADQQFRTAASFQTWRLHAPLSDVKTTSPVVIYSAESNTVTYTDSAYKFMADIITNCAQRSGRTFTRARHATLDS
jgi:hypothetical protein